MDPMLLLLGFLAMKGRSAPSSAPSSTTNGNGHAAQTVMLEAGQRYKFVGTLDSTAPRRREIRELLKLVDAKEVEITSDALSFVARMPLDVPFHPGTVHPQAPWLTLQAVEKLAPRQARDASDSQSTAARRSSRARQTSKSKRRPAR